MNENAWDRLTGIFTVTEDFIEQDHGFEHGHGDGCTGHYEGFGV